MIDILLITDHLKRLPPPQEPEKSLLLKSLAEYKKKLTNTINESTDTLAVGLATYNLGKVDDIIEYIR